MYPELNKGAYLIFGCIIVGLFIASNCSSDFGCPVSSLIETNHDGLLSYPYDIYDPVSFPDFSIDFSGHPYPPSYTSKFQNTYTCSGAASFHGVVTKHSCSNQTKCPIAVNNVGVLLNGTKWSVRNFPSYLNLMSRIFDKKITRKSIGLGVPVSSHESKQQLSRIVVIGGSVTAGQDTQGHCCSNLTKYFSESWGSRFIDQKCNKSIDCVYTNGTAQPDGENISWWSYLERFLVSTSTTTKIEFKIFATHGTTSEYVSESNPILTSLKELNLTSNDIIFLDYSYNDAYYFRGVRNGMMIRVIEQLIRKLLTLQPDQNSHNIPHIILLETNPQYYGIMNGESFCPKIEYVRGGILLGSPTLPTCQLKKFANVTSYSQAYRKVARHYKIQLWSVGDIAWSSYAQRFQPGLAYHFLNWNRPTDMMIHHHHIHWHAHLYLADLYATLMLLAADVGSGKSKQSMLQHGVSNSTATNNKFRNTFQRHANVFLSTSKRSHSTHQLDENKSGSRNTSTTSDSGTTSSSGSSSIQSFLPPPIAAAALRGSQQQCDMSKPLLLDFFITTDHKASSQKYYTDPPDSWRFFQDRKNKPGLITETEYPKNINNTHALIFPLVTEAVKDWIQRRPDPEERDVMLSISYLKSYKNMLTAEFELCGQLLKASVDGLWEEKYSLSTTVILPVGKLLLEEGCEKYIKQGKDVVLTILSPALHLGAEPGLMSVDKVAGYELLPLQERPMSKFKILCVTMCEVLTHGAAGLFVSFDG